MLNSAWPGSGWSGWRGSGGSGGGRCGRGTTGCGTVALRLPRTGLTFEARMAAGTPAATAAATRAAERRCRSQGDRQCLPAIPPPTRRADRASWPTTARCGPIPTASRPRWELRTRSCSRCRTPARRSGTARTRRGSSSSSCWCPMSRATPCSTPSSRSCSTRTTRRSERVIRGCCAGCSPGRRPSGSRHSAPMSMPRWTRCCRSVPTWSRWCRWGCTTSSSTRNCCSPT